ncbi:hypothetical protein D3Y59_11825 [Hymenobacter oligotrophus]|uniref:Entericidin n=1 Tax=Hymenobacter oligotrophus TaxID=2319843 RepID=A0A3B7R2N4_9BACT|nr:hypothetical protein [Hymenobacter oligotrophus]AYA37673.1 hypothetical protein D3Y59_11825 [Hymenobacter oligotrophus]
MKFSFKTLLAVAAFAAFATTSCSEKTQENAEATTESAANDAANATSDAANATSNAADAAGNAAADAVTPDNDGQNTVAPEKGDTAMVQNKPADGVVDETQKK